MVGVRLFVHNIPANISPQELRQLLSYSGAVHSVFVPRDRRTGRPRGFAIVDVADEAGAWEIIRNFNGYRLNRSVLHVEPAMECGEWPQHIPARASTAARSTPKPQPRRPVRTR